MRRKSVTIPTMLEPLGVMPSCSRPAVSNDPFSEVLFKTLKYRSSYPHRPCQDLRVDEPHPIKNYLSVFDLGKWV